MSFERTALRVAAMMALSNGFVAPFPTIAQARIYDSRQDQIEGLNPGDVVPTLILYTDDDTGDELSGNNGGPPFVHFCDLVMELTLGIATQYNGEGGSDPVLVIVPPQTEPELEVMLDAFEAQVKSVFRRLDGSWGPWLGRAMLKVQRWQSHRFVERETNIRLVSRQIRATVKLPVEADPDVVQTAPSEPVVPAPLGALLAAIVTAAGPFAATAAAMQAQITSNAPLGPIVLPMLETVRFIESEQAETNGSGVPRGPRAAGVAEAELPTS